MFTVAKTLEMLATVEKNLGEIARDMPRRAQARKQVFCPTEELGKVMRQAMDYSHDMRKVLLDGIKFYPQNDGEAWGLVLPEKERPYCTVLVDATTQPEADELSKEYAEMVEEWRKTGE